MLVVGSLWDYSVISWDWGYSLFPISSFQWAGGGEEEEKEVGQVENEDYYVCKLPNCGAVIQFETYGARSKILNLYTSQFYREQDYS